MPGRHICPANFVVSDLTLINWQLSRRPNNFPMRHQGAAVMKWKLGPEGLLHLSGASLSTLHRRSGESHLQSVLTDRQDRLVASPAWDNVSRRVALGVRKL